MINLNFSLACPELYYILTKMIWVYFSNIVLFFTDVVEAEELDVFPSDGDVIKKLLGNNLEECLWLKTEVYRDCGFFPNKENYFNNFFESTFF